MSVSRLNENPLRPAEHLLAWAFALSIAAHLLLYGGFQAGQHFGWWRKDLLPSWLKKKEQSLAEIQKAKQQQPPQPPPEPREAPLLFVEVDPAQAVAQPPKNAKYYSSQNAEAANPDLTIDSATPKIDGRQTHVPKTETTPRAKPMPLQPAPPKQPDAPQAEPEAKPKPKGGQQVGDLAMAKPAPQPAPQPGDGQAENDTGLDPTPVHKRPRTLVEAEAQKQSMVGEKMKQDGGVNHLKISPSFDTIATPFGEYDRELIDAISKHWYDLLDSRELARDRTGAVVVQFRLDYNGRISDLKVVDSNVGDLLSSVCELAIRDPAPFAKWPSDMRHYFGADYREIRFTFYYE